MSTKTKSILYWGSTALFALAMTGSGFATISRQAPMVEGYAHLGYPVSLLTLLGAWKLLGVAALVAPGLPRLKEWAYAGFVFNLTGAAYSHAAAGDAASQLVAPLILLTIGAISWATRSGARALPAAASESSSTAPAARSADLRVAA